jgi:hypothetical protein
VSKNSKNDEISLDITDQWICWWWFNDRCRRLDSTARVAAFKCFLKRTTISGEQHCMTWPLLDTLYIPFLLYPIGAGAYTEQALELLVRSRHVILDGKSWGFDFQNTSVSSVEPMIDNKGWSHIPKCWKWASSIYRYTMSNMPDQGLGIAIVCCWGVWRFPR